MTVKFSAFVKWAAVGAVAASALFATASASADVNGSIGVGVPGVAVVNPPMYYEPAPVYSAPSPVYYGPDYRYGNRRHHRRDWEDRDD